MSTKSSAYFVSLIALLLAGCATSPPVVMPHSARVDVRPAPVQALTEWTNVAQEVRRESVPTKPINITPLSSFSDEWTNESAAGGDFSGAYTRLVISSALPKANAGNLAGKSVDGAKYEGNEELLDYQGQNIFARYLWGSDFSINLTAFISVGNYESSIPLATIGHISNSEGEQWSRVIHHSRSDFPLFLVKNDGTRVPTIRISVAGAKSISSRGAATAVQVALGVAKATSASASVVTKLSEQTTKDRARAVDDAISKLFSSGIAEEHWSDRDLRTWNAQAGQIRGATLQFRIPGDESNWNSTRRDVGKWTITFDYPRPSIFSDWRICPANFMPRCAGSVEQARQKVHAGLDAGEVLNYTLVNGGNTLGTIRAYISQQDWYIAAQSALADPANRDVAAAGLCRRIRNDITALDLSGFDSEIVVWAVVNGMPIPAGVDFSEIKDCKRGLTTIAQNRGELPQQLAATGHN